MFLHNEFVWFQQNLLLLKNLLEKLFDLHTNYYNLTIIIALVSYSKLNQYKTWDMNDPLSQLHNHSRSDNYFQFLLMFSNPEIIANSKCITSS